MTRLPLARGFTLIEVLVALVIVAFGMGAVLSALTSSAQSTMRLREKTFAEWVGFNQLALARLALSPPAVGNSDGDVDFANARWHWQQQVENMEIPGLRRITITVRHLESKDDDWLATVMGFRGSDVNTGQGVLQGWDDGAPGGGGGGGGGGGAGGTTNVPATTPPPVVAPPLGGG